MSASKLEIYYSQQTSDFSKGKAYSNPRYFSTPRAGATKVYIVGDWPNIAAAYKAAGVPVVLLTEDMQPVVPLEPPVPVQLEKQKDYSGVEIPVGWREMPWVGVTSLRGLATKLTDSTVLNKSQAVAVILAELARREGAQVA